MNSRLKIVILDGYALNPGDLDYSPLEQYGDLTVYPRTTPEELYAHADKAQIVLLNKVELGSEQLRNLPDLRYVGLQSTGTNVVDLCAAREMGITVTNIPGYSSDSVAQLTFAHILNLSFHLSIHTQSVRDGRWTRHPDFCFWDAPLIELAGRTLGIIGFGSIGKKVARIGRVFGMHILMNQRTALPPPSEDPWYEQTSLETLLKRSDVVSLHCPLTPETTRLMNASRLSLMPQGAFLINTGRGGLVDDFALAEALNTGHLGGAGLDTLTVEPPLGDQPLLKAKNCYITPHFAWGTLAARQRCMDTAIRNVQCFLDGIPENVVT